MPDTAIAVPSRFTRDGLSEVINHLLGLGTCRRHVWVCHFLRRPSLCRAALLGTRAAPCSHSRLRAYAPPDEAVPFDFLINGTFLRSSLRKYMRKNGLSGGRLPARWHNTRAHAQRVVLCSALPSTMPASSYDEPATHCLRACVCRARAS